MQTSSFSSIIPQPSSKKHLPRAEAKATRQLQEEYASILGKLNRAASDLEAAQSNFDHVADTKAIDVCIYQIQTAQSQYENLIVQLKTLSDKIKTPGGTSVENTDTDIQIESK